MVFSPLEISGKISACENTVSFTMLIGSLSHTTHSITRGADFRARGFSWIETTGELELSRVHRG